LEAPKDMQKARRVYSLTDSAWFGKKTGQIVAYRDRISEHITDMPKALKSIALFDQDGFTIKMK
jgi:hypothetical protein